MANPSRMRRTVQWIGIAVVAALIVGGCTSRTVGQFILGAASLATTGVEQEMPALPTEAPSEETPEPSEPQTRGGESMPTGSTIEQLTERAKERLSEQLGISVDEIDVVSTEAVQWRDASLGCPQPGMMYAQVITPGYRIVLEAQGEQYEYHTDDRPQGQMVRCD